MNENNGNVSEITTDSGLSVGNNGKDVGIVESGDGQEITELSGELRIRIDMRYSRIHLHRNTLKAIRDPEYIQLGYDSRTKRLMIMGTWIEEQKAVHLHFTKQGSCYVHSKGMLQGIRRISGVLEGEGSYLLTGELLKGGPAVSFPLENARPMTEEEKVLL